MSDRRGTRLVALFVCLLVGVSTRLFPLWWSPLPATLDGFAYAGHARDVVQTGGFAFAGFRADALVSTALLSTGSLVTGVPPLSLAQPLYALVGSVGVLLGAIFARRLGRGLGWSRARTGRAAILAAFALAVEGVYVRRTGVPDDDAITLVAIPLVALAFHAYLRSERPAWLALGTLLLAVLPLTHTFSTLVAGLTVLALLAGTLVGRPLTRARLLAVGVFAAFCAYVAGYYAWAPSSALVVPYLDRVQAAPGLFLAWVVVLGLAVPWFRRTTTTARRVAALAPLGFVFLAIAVNSVVVIFPGTASTPQTVLLLVAPLVVPAVLGAAGGQWLGRDGPAAPALLALFAGPVALVGYAFTAGLTPEYVAMALRAQTHLHLPVVVVAAGVASRLGPSTATHARSRFRSVAATARPVVTVAFVVALLATLPAAYVNLDTGSYPSTTTESEFAAATFSADYATERWTGAQTQVRIARNYYDGVTASTTPTVSWLRGGPPPDCPVVSQRSWTTTGAHLFPAAPATIDPAAYSEWLANRSLVYDAGGADPVVITVPRSEGNGC